jgi:sugar phosphate isomerase/epimerase
MVERTRELAQVAAEHGVTLAVEFEPGFIVGSTEELMRLFDAIPSPYLAANLDLGHAFLCDHNPIYSILQLRDKVVHGHIENMKTGVHEHLLPWEGDMQLYAYIAALTRVGFTGGLALDLYKHDYEVVAPACVAYLHRMVK